MTLSRIRTLSLGQLGIMGTLSFSRQRLQFDSNADFSSTECLERYTDNERDYVIVYCEDFNAGIDAGLVIHFYKSAPHVNPAAISNFLYV